jgi:hypothetical protein
LGTVHTSWRAERKRLRRHLPNDLPIRFIV